MRLFLSMVMVQFLLPATLLAAAPNVVSIQVGAVNTVFVSVIVCRHGTRTCQTIPDVQLDTGSTGLRIFASSLNRAIPTASSINGLPIGECKIFGGGDSLWGQVAQMDVILGGERAENVPVHLINASFGRVPSNCLHPVQSQETWGHSNGILGVGPARSDCGGKACDPAHYLGSRYYACAAQGCSEVPLALEDQVQNPVALMPIDNNGVIVRFPALPRAGAGREVQGEMILGIGTSRNNNPPAGTTTFTTEEMGWMPILFGNERYWSKIDTGDSEWDFPQGKSGLPHCATSGDWSIYLCPPSAVQVPFTVTNLDGSVRKELFALIGNAREEFALTQGKFLHERIGMEFPGINTRTLTLGLPFFFGRNVYFGIDGKRTPLGNGPFYAF